MFYDSMLRWMTVKNLVSGLVFARLIKKAKLERSMDAESLSSRYVFWACFFLNLVAFLKK